MINTWQIIIIKNCKLENVDLKNILLLKINRTLFFKKLERNTAQHGHGSAHKHS